MIPTALNVIIVSWVEILRSSFPFYVAGIATGIFVLFILSHYGISTPKLDSKPSETKKSEVNSINDAVSHKTEETVSDRNEPKPSNEKRRDPPDIGRVMNGILVFIFLWIVLTIVGQQYGFTIAGLLKLLFPRETHLIQQMISLVWYYACFEQSTD